MVFLTFLVCVSDALVAEIKRIVKESEILKSVSILSGWQQTADSAKGRRHEMAAEEQRWPSGA